MSAGRSARLTGSRRRVALAAPAALLLLGACVIPPKPIAAPSPEALPTTPPAVSVWSPNMFPSSSGLPSLYFSTDRPAYATVFEADRRGRVRVIYPRTPREDGRVVPGQTYTALSNGVVNDRMFVTVATDWRRLPFLFVVVSDARPDLSDFGRGRAWAQQVRTDGVEAEDVVEAVAQRVTAGSGRPYATDFAYIGPRLTAREAFFAASCANPVHDARDYWYYRDLWAVFTPADPTLGLTPVFAFGTMLTWASAPYIGVAYDRAQRATGAFRAGCVTPFQQPLQWANPLLFAANRRFSPGTVAIGTPTVPAPVAFTPTLPRGAQPVEPRIPKLPREIADGTVRPGDAPNATSGTDRQARAWFSPGGRRTGGVVAEPIDRRPDDAARRWGQPSAWTRGAMVGAATDEGGRVDRRASAREGGSWSGGAGWARRLGGSGADAGATARVAPPPARETAAAGRSAGWTSGLGGGANGGTPGGSPTASAGERAVAPMSEGGSAKTEGSQVSPP